MNLKATVRIGNGRSEIPAQVVGVTQCEPYQWQMCVSGPTVEYSTRALILLLQFSRGQVIEAPWDKVTIVDQWDDENPVRDFSLGEE
jgi:hypothetical protein